MRLPQEDRLEGGPERPPEQEERDSTMSTGALAAGAWQPKICENVPDVADRTLRWAAQLGITALALSGRLADPDGKGYWTVEACRAVADRVRAHGLEVGIMMFNLSPLVVWGRPGRDEGRSAGSAGRCTGDRHHGG